MFSLFPKNMLWQAGMLEKKISETSFGIHEKNVSWDNFHAKNVSLENFHEKKIVLDNFHEMSSLFAGQNKKKISSVSRLLNQPRGWLKLWAYFWLCSDETGNARYCMLISIYIIVCFNDLETR